MLKLIDLLLLKYKEELGIVEIKDYGDEIVVYFSNVKKYEEIPKILEGDESYYLKNSGRGILDNPEIVNQGLYCWAWYSKL